MLQEYPQGGAADPESIDVHQMPPSFVWQEREVSIARIIDL